MKMRFKDFEFASNPSVIKVGNTANYHIDPLPRKNCVVENVSINPAVVEGKGEFYAKEGLEACNELQKLLRQRTSGWLFAPGIVPIRAYLTDFSWEQDAKNKAYSYSFRFVEDCTDKQELQSLTLVTAKSGQNAFDIAYENGVSVDDIITLNNLATPFDIKENDEVAIR